MRRYYPYRRNQESSFLTSPEPRPLVKPASLRDLMVLGIVVNPKFKEPVLATTDEHNVGVRSLREQRLFTRHGSGYYDTTGYGRSEEAEELTGYPRCHTPDGSSPKQMGYGTSLYTALALGAYLTDEEEATIRMTVKGAGVCSEPTRSSEADVWWARANQRGLTDQEDSVDEETEENVEVSDQVTASEIEGLLSLAEDQSVSYLNTVNVDIETRKELTVDSYSYKDAFGSDLVVCEISVDIDGDVPYGAELSYLIDEILDDPDEVHDINRDALLALDVRGLDRDAIKLLSYLYAQADYGDKEIDALWYRYENNLDPGDPESPQLRLFSPNARAGGLSDVLEARLQTSWDRFADLP